MSTIDLDLDFRHVFEPATGTSTPPVLLLHGTGGNEHDLLPLGRAVAPGAAFVSPRGKVLENGMPRFFRRLAEGVFDEDDLRARTDELAAFIDTARERYRIGAPIALGFSNGANIAASLLLRHPGVLRGAILLRAMVPFRQTPAADLTGTKVLLLSGSSDPIAPPNESAALAQLLESAGAAVTHRAVPAGHGLTQVDLTLAGDWIGQF
jgi:phospholipase/carboxylesterase